MAKVIPLKSRQNSSQGLSRAERATWNKNMAMQGIEALRIRAEVACYEAETALPAILQTSEDKSPCTEGNWPESKILNIQKCSTSLVMPLLTPQLSTTKDLLTSNSNNARMYRLLNNIPNKSILTRVIDYLRGK